MATYSYRTVNINTNAILEDLDLQQVSFSIKLSDVGSLDGTLYVPDDLRGQLLDDATVPGRTGLYVFRNEVPVWGGIIWKRSWDEKTASFKITCGSWESYAYHVLQLLNKSYTNADQLQIARDLINQASIPAQAGITAPASGSSGRLRQREMWTYEYKTVGLELEQLSALEDGFDYTVQPYVKEDGSFGRRYLFGYPRLGRTATLNPADNSLTFDYPGNLAPFELVEDAENGAFRLYAIGAGEGTEMIVASAVDPSYAATDWPTLDAVVQYKDISIISTLQSHANEDLRGALPPLDSWSFVLAPDSDVHLENINIGDSAVFRLKSRRWKDPKIMIRRITEINVQPGSQTSLEVVRLGLSDERVTS